MQITKNTHALMLPVFLQEFESLTDRWMRAGQEQMAITLNPHHNFTQLVLSHIVYTGTASRIAASVKIHFIDVQENAPAALLLSATLNGEPLAGRHMEFKGNYSGLEAGMRELAGHLLAFFANGTWLPKDGFMASANKETFGPK